MKTTALIASLVIVQAMILVSAQGQTTVDGVYTAVQAARGEAVYKESCASCHGDDLSGGGQAPSLTGKEFNSDWIDLSLNDLYERTHVSMPADNPGSLTPAKTVDVISFLLSKGSFPAGQTELAADGAALKAIKFVAPK